MKNRQPWSDFTNKKSQSFVRSLVAGASYITPADLVDMAQHKSTGAIKICLAYAQDELIYGQNGKIIAVNSDVYAKTNRKERVNKFALAYPRDRKFLLHKTLADIVVVAANYLYKTMGWRTILYDGLRTVDGAFALYNFASDEDLTAGLLALPAKSAHNKGLAVDSMMVDADGCEIEMGGHFDHLDMTTNMRNYIGDKISENAKQNRLIREAAFLRAAFSLGWLIAPLRSEFWDDRLPENHEDLWRVLDSVARVAGVPAFLENKEAWNYADFLHNWQKTFHEHDEKLIKTIGCITPPLTEKPEFYHGNYHPIYDADL
jgi:D-alanyl-D-alanine dipeptidase